MAKDLAASRAAICTYHHHTSSDPRRKLLIHRSTLSLTGGEADEGWMDGWKDGVFFITFYFVVMGRTCAGGKKLD